MPQPLVSVCIIAYNSEQTILETLASVYEQTYQNIELIISDDNSNDNTVLVSKQWLDNHKQRFYKTVLITSNKNTGVTLNCNRAVKVAEGKFIKDFGADDILYSDYIENCVTFFNEHEDCNVLFTKLTPFLENDKTNIVILPEDYNFLNLSQSEQFSQMIKNGLPLLPTPSCIYTKTILKKMNYFDEDIPMWEDGPMYFKLSENNEKMFFLNVEGVYYRIRQNSLSNQRPVSHIISISKFYFKYQLKYERKIAPLKYLYHCFKYFFGMHSDKFFPKMIFTLTQLLHKKRPL